MQLQSHGPQVDPCHPPARLRWAQADLDLATLSLSNAALRFVGQAPAETFQARGCSLDLHSLRSAPLQLADFIRRLSFTAELKCGEVITHVVTASELKASISSFFRALSSAA